MPESHVRRRESLRASLREQELSGLLVTDLLNLRYLTGFTGSNGALLVHAEDTPNSEDRTLFGTDGRYLTQSADQVPELERIIERPTAEALCARAAREPASYRRLGFESQQVTVDGLDALNAAADAVPLVRAPGLVEQRRMVKDEGEIEALRMACAAADRALADLLEHGGLRPGRTEREVARELEDRMLDHGAAGRSFETIVAAGPNSAIPHHRPSDAVLAEGDFVKMDFGALVDGYHSDMTRTLILGDPAEWQREIYELVHAAQAAGRAAARPGAEVRAVDRAARAVIEDAGYGEQFLHGLGHGVGLAVHEAPMLGGNGAGTLFAGMAVTVEPGVYLTGRGGVRIEDTLVVRDDSPEILTLSTKQLTVA
ncbi:Xaa-Pro dipeptidase [Tamaricihabitans halophyticus]|uniref:Xaa-Pro dipeptidase n=1 Tax=Tamaricihabitans halophyticus TaxID=1262583 RepID=A0A4V6NR57_9PSEU|nr:aminopeptidase P family protein [Tamaricihabitans halophyticus]TCP46266.1 Xaa-Pro dipeptidase [Tamaricihabitans halophyticus]